MAKQGSVTIVRDPLFGDSGKAKIVDLLISIYLNIRAVVRFHGGDNAGHTIVTPDKQRFAVHALPSGVIWPHERSVLSVIGRGVVINLPRLFHEIDELGKLGVLVTPVNLLVSEGAQLTLPYHMALERARENGDAKKGTTVRGISMTYGFARMYQGLRAGDIRDLDYARGRIAEALSWANAIITNVYGGAAVSMDEVMVEIETYRTRLQPYLGNEALVLNRMIQEGHDVLCEGAQSLMLDNDLGIYPNATASNTVPGAIQAGCGLNPQRITRDILVVKAFISRVGQGHLVGEILGELADTIRTLGHEFGTTSGRPRRIGRPDDVVANYCRMVAPGTELAITKADILTNLRLEVCTEYTIGGQSLETFPTSELTLRECRGTFEPLPTWTSDFTGASNWDDIPEGAQQYLKRIAEPFGCPIGFVGTGPGRDQIITCS